MANSSYLSIPIEPCYVYRAAFARVIDGDTFVAKVDLGFNVFCNVTVRLYGVDAYEHNKPGGPEATAFLSRYIATPLLLRSHKDQQSFARWVCEVFVYNGNGTWKDLAQEIIDAGHGVPLHIG